jgi:hypothetical protein
VRQLVCLLSLLASDTATLSTPSQATAVRLLEDATKHAARLPGGVGARTATCAASAAGWLLSSPARLDRYVAAPW